MKYFRKFLINFWLVIFFFILWENETINMNKATKNIH